MASASATVWFYFDRASFPCIQGSQALATESVLEHSDHRLPELLEILALLAQLLILQMVPHGWGFANHTINRIEATEELIL